MSLVNPDKKETRMNEEEVALIAPFLSDIDMDKDVELTEDDLEKSKKLTQTQKNALLFVGAEEGNVEKIKIAIKYGADLDAMTRASPYDTALSIAIKSGKNSSKNDDAIKYLIKAGCLCQHGGYHYGSCQSKEAERFQKAKKENIQELILITLVNLVDCSSGELLDWARLYYKGVYADKNVDLYQEMSVVDSCFKKNHFAQGLYFIKKYNLYPSPDALNNIGHALNYHLAEENKSVYGVREREAAFEVLKTASKNISSNTVQNIFNLAIRQDDITLLKTLLISGYKPINWSCSHEVAQYKSGQYIGNKKVHTNILIDALGQGDNKCFNLLKKFKNLQKSVINDKIDPALLSRKSITELLILNDLGVDICTQDQDGKNFLHHWADSDRYEPRNGWATMLRKFPSLVEQKDINGQSAKDHQIQILRGNTGYYKTASEAAVQKFEKSLTRIESQLIKKEIGKIKNKKSSPSKDDVPVVERKRVRL